MAHLSSRARHGAGLLRWAAALALVCVLAACGGGGGDAPASASGAAPLGSSTPGSGTASPGTTTPAATTPPAGTGATPIPTAASNVLPMVLDRGTDGTALNAPFVSVTVCQPGTQTCRTIDHVLVDTGSAGLRLNASALGALALPPAAASGGALAECASFASGYTWGSVRSADIRLAGEHADAVPVQVVDDPAAAYATVPAACSDTGAALDAAGSNGILGVSFSVRDCGTACANSALPGMYFSCAAAACSGVAVPASAQVANPAALLAGAHNNGVALVLPRIAAGGVPSAAGSLVLGIGTAANNQLGSLGIFAANSRGNFSTTYKGRASSAFIDSGSNGIFFADSSIARCPSGFYCPPSTLALSATVAGTNGTTRDVGFAVENPSGMAAGTSAAYLGGSAIAGSSFDWGLPFFLGRAVFVAFDGRSTPAGLGPFWAF